MCRIIVLTPVKNEEWILNSFLTVCSIFADHIIIADQNSTDNSVEIAKSFEKVIFIKNENKDFNEAERQLLLINKARELFGIGNILLALDADELIIGNAIQSPSWNLMKHSKPGTVFYFDKPTILFDQDKVLRYPDGFPLAVKDDGSKHNPTKIHSTRIPLSLDCDKMIINDISFLHLCFVRNKVQFSKNRYYCVLENIKQTKNLRNRIKQYDKHCSKDYEEGIVENINPDWIELYTAHNLKIRNFEEQDYYYTDFEVLKLFQIYGERRFYNDPIWYFDWESCRKQAINDAIEGIPLRGIKFPARCRIYLITKFFHLFDKMITIMNFIMQNLKFNK
jgi:hypothetical protein